jgi:hypothetical protein
MNCEEVKEKIRYKNCFGIVRIFFLLKKTEILLFILRSTERKKFRVYRLILSKTKRLILEQEKVTM